MIATQRGLRSGQPLWLQDSGHRTRYPVFTGPAATSVAIVGGGLTGALIAHTFASAGIATTILEAGLTGQGSTGASSALLLQEPDLELTQLTKRYGSGASRRIWERSRDSARGLMALLRRLNVRCDLEARDAIYYATDATALARLQREYALRGRAGFAATWLGPAALRRSTGISARGAIRTHGSAQFDPYRACLGLLAAAHTAGANIFERSRIRRIVPERDRATLWTDRGALDCDRVVIATGYATAGFRPLAGRFRMYRTYVLASRTLGRRERDDIGLSNVMVWDTERPYHYARWTHDRRLLLGGSDRVVRAGAGRSRQFLAATQELRDYFETRFPAFGAIETDYAWEGVFATTPDTLPYIGPHRRYPRHWFALGYGGNGMTFGYLAAQLLLERWHNEVSRDHALFGFERIRRR